MTGNGRVTRENSRTGAVDKSEQIRETILRWVGNVQRKRRDDIMVGIQKMEMSEKPIKENPKYGNEWNPKGYF